MKKSFFENLDVIGLGVVFALVLSLIRGMSFSEAALHVTFAAVVIVFAMTADDIDFKLRYYPELFNKWEILGCGLVLIADVAFWYAALSESAFTLWFCLGLTAVAGVGAFLVFLLLYVPSVASEEELDAYDRARYEKKIAKAKTADDVANILAKFLRYQCKNDSYESGSDFSKPFDSDGRKTLKQVKREKSDDAETLAKVIETYEKTLAQKIIAARAAAAK